MKRLSKIVWREGMYLAPHHFQAQSRFFEDLVGFTVSALGFKPYGVTAAEFDPDALSNGIVLCRKLRGVFSDGLPFDCPASDPSPEPLPLVNRFPSSKATEIVCLTVPPRNDTGPDFSRSTAVPARFRAVEQSFRDETNGQDDRQVEIGQKNIQLMLLSELPPGSVALPVALIKRTGAGTYAADPDYIPVCMELSGSLALLDLTRRIADLLLEQSAALSPTAIDGPLNLADAYRSMPERFWLLHCLNSALAPLKHLLANTESHPECLYRELARLAGALGTFTLSPAPPPIPSYNHDDPTSCFQELERLIVAAIRLVRPQNFARFPLPGAAGGIMAAAVDDARCYQRSRWLLGVRCSSGEAKTMREIPVQAKLCSEEFVPRLVQRAIPGMELTHLPAAPPGFPPQFDFEYFAIGLRGPCWEHLMKTRRVGLWVPREFGDVQAEIVVLWEG